jgi:hypothetical protein
MVRPPTPADKFASVDHTDKCSIKTPRLIEYSGSIVLFARLVDAFRGRAETRRSWRPPNADQ